VVMDRRRRTPAIVLRRWSDGVLREECERLKR
jgi:hypothetical protein